jgi:hypothetical protein
MKLGGHKKETKEEEMKDIEKRGRRTKWKQKNDR